MIHYKIYQIDFNVDVDRMAFKGIEGLKARDLAAPTAEIYKMVYEGSLNLSSDEEQSSESILEVLFFLFNAETETPKDYKGRNMSVSDVVELRYENVNFFYFCDSVGFQEIEFDKRKVLK